MGKELRKTDSGLIYPLQGRWQIRNKTLPADQNIFGDNLPSRAKKKHWGWDLSAPVGTNVYSIGDGKVINTSIIEGYGQVVMHGFKFNNKTCYVVYAHLSYVLVSVGDTVARGQIVGLTGVSGNADAKDPHLHLEFHSDTTLLTGPVGKINPKVFFGDPPI